MQTNILQRVFSWVITTHENYKIRRDKQRKFNSQIIKHKLSMSQFFSIKHLMANDEGGEDDDDSTFRNLDYVAKIGLTPNNENLWPTISNVVKRRSKQTVIPANVPDGS